MTDQNKDEPLIVAAIKDKLDKVESPFEDLNAKLTDLEGILQAAQIRSQEFNVSFSEFKDKLQDMEELAANLKPVSAIYDRLKEQKNDDEELQDKIQQQKPVFEQLLKNGKNLLESAEPGAEKDELEAKLADTERRWNETEQIASEHSARVDTALPEAETYRESASSLEPWLADTERKLTLLEPIVASQDLVEKLSDEVALLREDIDKHRPERDSVSEKSKAVVELTDADGDVVGNEAQETVDRYDALDAALAAKEKDLQDVKQMLDKYHVLVQPVEDTLETVGAELASQGPVSADVKKNEEDLARTKALIRRLKDMRDNLDSAETSGKETAEAITALDGDPTLVQEELKAVGANYDSLLAQLKDKQSQLEQAIGQGLELQEKLDEIEAWTVDSAEKVDAWEPISTDAVTAKKQLEELQ